MSKARRGFASTLNVKYVRQRVEDLRRRVVLGIWLPVTLRRTLAP
jgi:hypothetical protein